MDEGIQNLGRQICDKKWPKDDKENIENSLVLRILFSKLKKKREI